MTKRKVMIHILTSRLTWGKEIFDALDEELDTEESEIEDAEAIPAGGEMPEPIELIMEGRLLTGSDRVELVYEESELSGMEGSLTTIGFRRQEPGLISMLRTGLVNTALVFEEGKRHFCIYHTPFSDFEICVYTRRVDNRLLTEGVITLDYLMEIHGAQAEHTRMTVTVRPLTDPPFGKPD